MKKSIKKKLGELELYILLLPLVIWYALFAYKPMLGLVIAFKDYNLFKGISGSDWVGLANFKAFLTSPYFYTTFKNTIVLGLYSLLIVFPFSIVLALMLNEIKKKYFKSFVQTVTFIPYFISVVVAAGILINMLSPSIGVVNFIIEKLGFEKQYFMAQPEKFRAIFTSLSIWKEGGFNAIVYLAALAGIDASLYEAADMDGANKWKKLIHITVPSIMPTIIIMFILKIGVILNVSFETVLLLYQPATYSTSDVISTYVYRTGLLSQDFGLATAVGLFNAILAFLLVYGANKLSKKFTETSLW